MKLQRGTISPEFIVGGISLLIIVCLVAGGIFYVRHVATTERAAGVIEGRKAALLAVAERDNKDLVAAQKEILRLTDEKEALERTAAQRVADIDKEGRDALKALEGQHNQFLDDLFAGRIRLPGQRRSDASCPGGGEGGPAEVAGAAGVGDGAADTELRAKAGRFFGTEAKRADGIVVQLTACQKIVRTDRGQAP